MQVNVFFLRASNDCRPTLLLIPDDKPNVAIPKHLRPWNWEYFFTTVSTDTLIGGSTFLVDELLRRDGYVTTQPDPLTNWHQWH